MHRARRLFKALISSHQAPSDPLKNRRLQLSIRSASTSGINVYFRLMILCFMCLSAYGQASDPWSNAATKMGNIFTGPIARGFSLVAIVIGGLSLAFSDGSGKRAIGGLIFGLGMALGATSFMAWFIS